MTDKTKSQPVHRPSRAGDSLSASGRRRSAFVRFMSEYYHSLVPGSDGTTNRTPLATRRGCRLRGRLLHLVEENTAPAKVGRCAEIKCPRSPGQGHRRGLPEVRKVPGRVSGSRY